MKKPNNPARVAVFISGPVRYAGLVRERVAHLLAPFQPVFFFHLWKEDWGNKIRQGYESDWRELATHEDTKLCLLHQPYDKAFYEKLMGSNVNTHSTINAILGMFLALGQLSALFRTLPDRNSFTHILRIRTDCALTVDHFVDLLNWEANTVTLSTDPGLPAQGWACDHLLFAPAELFLNIYALNEISSLYEIFEISQRNPEKMLHHLLSTRLTESTSVFRNIERYRHYQLVYSPPRAVDSPWLRELVLTGRHREIFIEPEKFRNETEDAAVAKDQAIRWPFDFDIYGSPLINKVRDFVRGKTDQ